MRQTTTAGVCHDEGKTTSFMRNQAKPIDSAARGTHRPVRGDGTGKIPGVGARAVARERGSAAIGRRSQRVSRTSAGAIVMSAVSAPAVPGMVITMMLRCAASSAGFGLKCGNFRTSLGFLAPAA
jgi:hypothetical protein